MSYKIKKPNYQLIFGDSSLRLQDLDRDYRGWRNIHQVHGNNVVLASQNTIKADGQYSLKKGEPLLIKTADCMPVLLAHPEGVIALHIGWRGLAQRILSKAIETTQWDSKLELWLGPHIHQKSFELDRNCCDPLLRNHSVRFSEAFDLGILKASLKQQSHFLFSLSKLLQREAQSLGITQFNDINIDTYTSPFHYSYRRNRFNTGRNYSIIIKK